MRWLTAFALSTLLAAPAAAGIAGDQLCRAAGQSSGCIDASWPRDSYRPPRDRDDAGREVPVGCPECRAETIRRLGHFRQLQPPAWSEEDQRREILGSIWRDERRTAGALGPLLAAKPPAKSPLPAPAAEPFPYKDSDVETAFGGEYSQLENLYNKELLGIYREFWKKPAFRRTLRLIKPLHFKAMMAKENGFKAGLMKHCGYLAVKCRVKGEEEDAALIGVGIAALIRGTATGDPLHLVVDAQTDERLDPEEALRAGLRLLIRYHERIVEMYEPAGKQPDEMFEWELTVLSYNTSPKTFNVAITAAAKALNKPFEKVSLSDIIEVQLGQEKSFFEKALKNHKKFVREARGYLPNVRKLLPKDDPRRGAP